MDLCLKNGLESILNITFDENQWIQAGLPISKGGIGIRKISDISLPAFLSSLHGVRSLMSLILPIMDNEVTPHHWNESLDYWNSLNNCQLPVLPLVQKSWDTINIDRTQYSFSIIKRYCSFQSIARTRIRRLAESNSFKKSWYCNE